MNQLAPDQSIAAIVPVAEHLATETRMLVLNAGSSSPNIFPPRLR